MFRLIHVSVLLSVILLSASLAGCGRSERGVKVSGNVTLDGNPLDKGTITFTLLEGTGKMAQGNIMNGKYSVEGVGNGKNRVEISASTSTPGQKPDQAEQARRSAQIMREGKLIEMRAKNPKEARKKMDEIRGITVTVDKDTIGNNQVIEVRGSLEQDFTLQSPGK